MAPLPPVSWSLVGQSSIDRAGGPLHLQELSRRLVGRRWSVSEEETSGWIGVRVTAAAERGHARLVEWVTVAPASRSVSVREDQRDTVAGDAIALEDLLRSEVRRLEDESLSELELRALYGDR